MDELKIRNLIREEIQRSAGQSQFRLNAIPFHTHNGTDSPYVFTSTVQYTGYVPSDADISGASIDGFLLFPQGWTMEVASDTYTITHNLNTEYYTVVFCATSTVAADGVAPQTVCSANSFDVSWQNTAGTKSATDFHFLLTVVNNSGQNIPLYNTK